MVTFGQSPIILTVHNVIARNTQLYVAASTQVSYIDPYDKAGWHAPVQATSPTAFKPICMHVTRNDRLDATRQCPSQNEFIFSLAKGGRHLHALQLLSWTHVIMKHTPSNAKCHTGTKISYIVIKCLCQQYR